MSQYLHLREEKMGTDFKDFLLEIEEEAAAEGPEAVAELEGFRTHYQVARELLALRRMRQLTQHRLAELSGVGQSEISRIESGRANPTVGTLAALAAPLGADLHLVQRD
jgi:DNA-binding XRE family transcriptional regulator